MRRENLMKSMSALTDQAVSGGWRQESCPWFNGCIDLLLGQVSNCSFVSIQHPPLGLLAGVNCWPLSG
jgi:hypothetical protein